MSKYFVRGTIALTINESSESTVNTIIFAITPTSQFIAPYKDKQRISAFSVPVCTCNETEHKTGVSLTAIIADLNDGAKECKISNDLVMALLPLSVHQKVVELYVDDQWKVTGFKIPV